MSPRPRPLAALLLGLSACTARPLDQDTDTSPGATSSSSTSSSASSSSTSSTATTDTTDTTDATTTTAATDATSTSTSTTSTNTTGGGPPSTCGPPCAETWEIDGDLTVFAWGDPPIHFDCLTAVHGSLTIEEDVPQGVLASLANLREVDGNLQLKGHKELTDVGFLGCLEEVGTLLLGAAPALTDLTALSQLRVADQIYLGGLGITALPTFAPDFTGISLLWLENDPALTDLSPATTWGLSGDWLEIKLDNNAALTDLAGLAGLIGEVQAGLYVQITRHPAMTSLAGLESAAAIDSLDVEDLPELTDLAALSGLVDANSITLDKLPKVTSLAGLGNLVTLGTLTLGGCLAEGEGGLDALTSLAGLDALTSLGAAAIANNDALVSLDGAPELTSILAELAVVSNPALPQKAYDAFLAQLDGPPNTECFGGWGECACFQILPW